MNAWNGKRAFIVDPEGDLRTCVCTCLYEFVYTATLKIKQNYTQISIKIQPKIIPKSIKNRPKNRPKIDQNSIQNRLWKQLRFRDPFWSDFGPILAPTWGHLGCQVGAMLAKKLIFGGSRRHAKTTMISNTFRDPLGADFGAIWGSKIEPKSIQDRSQERS